MSFMHAADSIASSVREGAPGKAYTGRRSRRQKRIDLRNQPAGSPMLDEQAFEDEGIAEEVIESMEIMLRVIEVGP